MRKLVCLLLALLLLCGSALSEEMLETDLVAEEDPAMEEVCFEEEPEAEEPSEEERLAEESSAPGISGEEPASAEAEPVLSLPKEEESTLSFAPMRTVWGVGETFVLRMTEDIPVTFASQSPKLCSVKTDGTVKALRTGTCVLTAQTADGKSAQVTLTVVKAPSKVTVSAPRTGLGVGESVLPSAVLNNGNLSACTFSSSNTKVLKVMEDGSFLAVGKGKASIVAKAYNGKKGSLRITVTAAPTRLSFPGGVLEMAALDSAKYPATADSASTITYRVADESVLSVENGTFRALAAGETTVTAQTYNGVEAQCRVKVSPPLESLTLTTDRTVYGVGEFFTPALGLLPADCTNPTVRVSTSNSKIAAVQKDGRIKALRTGTVVIRATPYRGESAEITITVVKAPSRVTLSAPQTVLAVGQKSTLKCNLNNGNTSACTFSSSNTKVLHVDADGTITAVAPGSVTVTAKAYNKKSARIKLKVVGAPKKITFAYGYSTMTMGLDDTFALNPATDSAARGLVTLESGNTACVTVDSAGRLHAQGEGTALVTARTYNGLEKTLKVHVVRSTGKPSPVCTTLMPSAVAGADFTLELKRGTSETVACVPVDLDVCSQTVVSQNPKIVTVSGTKVTAKRKGAAHVRVTLYNGTVITVLVTVV